MGNLIGIALNPQIALVTWPFLAIYCQSKAFLMAQLVENLPAMWETWVRSLGWEGLLQKGMATHSSILAWRIPWTVLYCPWGHKESDTTEKLSLSCFPIQEHGICFHFIELSSISFINVLQFLAYRSFISLVRFILRCYF